MVVNIEWGAFGEDGSIDFIRSRYDEEIDQTSIHIGKQMFVKWIKFQFYFPKIFKIFFV
jgi:hexokinase